MKDPVRWAVFAVVVVVVAAGLYYWQRSQEAAPQPPSAHQQAPAASATRPPQIRFPLPQGGETPSLPALDQSDSSMREQFAGLFGLKDFEAFFNLQGIIRRIVATIDNLPREKLAPRLMPVKPAAGPFVAAGDDADRSIGERNAARYQPYVRIAESVDIGKLVGLYVTHYPLFQQAYRELGYPSGYFNDRLVEVIDHLLAAPEVQEPVKLVQRKVLYEFADPELESRSAGQKVMIRIGPGNAARLKARLRDVRRELTSQVPKS